MNKKEFNNFRSASFFGKQLELYALLLEHDNLYSNRYINTYRTHRHSNQLTL